MGAAVYAPTLREPDKVCQMVKASTAVEVMDRGVRARTANRAAGAQASRMTWDGGWEVRKLEGLRDWLLSESPHSLFQSVKGQRW